jgi:hypothetical protein
METKRRRGDRRETIREVWVIVSLKNFAEMQAGAASGIFLDTTLSLRREKIYET